MRKNSLEYIKYIDSITLLILIGLILILFILRPEVFSWQFFSAVLFLIFRLSVLALMYLLDIRKNSKRALILDINSAIIYAGAPFFNNAYYLKRIKELQIHHPKEKTYTNDTP